MILDEEDDESHKADTGDEAEDATGHVDAGCIGQNESAQISSQPQNSPLGGAS